MLENTEGAIKNEQSRETGNIEYTRRRKTKQNHNTICVGHHYGQIDKDESNVVFKLISRSRILNIGP
jgi:hypothetical protein